MPQAFLARPKGWSVGAEQTRCLLWVDFRSSVMHLGSSRCHMYGKRLDFGYCHTQALHKGFAQLLLEPAAVDIRSGCRRERLSKYGNKLVRTSCNLLDSFDQDVYPPCCSRGDSLGSLVCLENLRCYLVFRHTLPPSVLSAVRSPGCRRQLPALQSKGGLGYLKQVERT